MVVSVARAVRKKVQKRRIEASQRFRKIENDDAPTPQQCDFSCGVGCAGARMPACFRENGKINPVAGNDTLKERCKYLSFFDIISPYEYH